eukprot:TRINITY_DN4362_c2_g1_i1.p1 TRINITY_DN4362_c2_g1~~TRINITY_DN4362_c2_g1_i1.p1  ORF type:complete len:371 (+),score=90.91 TRINITY_DN4362_c2_g1_i1:90-1202(+)
MSTYASCEDLDAMVKVMNLEETKEQIAGELLDRGWFATASRKVFYSPGEHAWVIEKFVLIQDNHPPTAFRVEATGNLILVSSGHKECVYTPQEEKDVEYDIHPELELRRACYASHESRFFSLYRFSFEVHFKNPTKLRTHRKNLAFNFLRANMDAVNPVEFVPYMKAIFKEVKNNVTKDELPVVMAKNFKHRSQLYGTLKNLESAQKAEQQLQQQQLTPKRNQSPAPPSPASGKQTPEPQPPVTVDEKTPSPEVQKNDEVAARSPPPPNLMTFDNKEQTVATQHEEELLSTLSKMAFPKEDVKEEVPVVSERVPEPSPSPSPIFVESSPTQLQPPANGDNPLMTFENPHREAILSLFSDNTPAQQPTISS